MNRLFHALSNALCRRRGTAFRRCLSAFFPWLSLQRLRSISRRRPRALLCVRAGGSSLRSPSGSHCCRQLLATFRREVEFSFRALSGARSFHASRWFYASLRRLHVLVD